MPKGNAVTVVVGAFLTIVPQLLRAVPAPYNDVASGLVAAAVAAWHLYQPSPTISK